MRWRTPILVLACAAALVMFNPRRCRADPDGHGEIDGWRSMLRTGDDDHRLIAVQNLATWVRRSKPAVEALTNALDDANRTVRYTAITALGNAGASGSPSVTSLARLLSSDDPLDRCLAARSLGRIGLAAKPAVPALLRLADNWHPEVREAAAEALGRAGGHMPDVIDAPLLDLLNDRWPEVRRAAATALQRLGPRAAPAAEPALLATLADADWSVRQAALLALAALGPEARAHASAVLDRQATGGRDIRSAIERRADRVILERPIGASRSSSAGPNAARGLEYLAIARNEAQGLDDRRSAVRAAALLLPGDEHLTDAVLEMLNDSDAKANLVGFDALELSDCGTNASVRRAVALLRSSRQVEVRDAAMHAWDRLDATP